MKLLDCANNTLDIVIIHKSVRLGAFDLLLGDLGIDGLDLGISSTYIGVAAGALSNHSAFAVQKVAVQDHQLLEPVLPSDELNLGSIELIWIVRVVVCNLCCGSSASPHAVGGQEAFFIKDCIDDGALASSCISLNADYGASLSWAGQKLINKLQPVHCRATIWGLMRLERFFETAQEFNASCDPLLQ